VKYFIVHLYVGLVFGITHDLKGKQPNNIKLYIVSQKVRHRLFVITLSDTGRYSVLFQCCSLQEICSKVIIQDSGYTSNALLHCLLCDILMSENLRVLYTVAVLF